MNKSIIPFIIIVIVAVFIGGYFLTVNQNTPLVQDNKISSKINVWEKLSSSWVSSWAIIIRNDFILKQLWASKDEVANAFYLPENKIIIINWLKDSNNRAQSSRGDILEFLSYCEELNISDHNKAKNLTEIFWKYDRQNLEDFMRTDKALIWFAQNNKVLSKEGILYSQPWYSTVLIRKFYLQNTKELQQDQAHYAFAYNDIFAFLKGELSLIEFQNAMDWIIALNHQSSKLYSGLYKEYYSKSEVVNCRDILKNYGREEQKFTQDE